MLLSVVDVVAHEDRSQWNPEQRPVLRPFADLGYRNQPGVAVDAAPIVTDESGIDLAVATASTMRSTGTRTVFGRIPSASWST